jgi:hypothetical protein
MATWFDISANALAQSLDCMGEEFDYLGQTYKGVINETNTSEVLNFGGFETHISCEIYMQKRGFPTPAKGDRLTIRGIERRIVRTADHPNAWSIYLEDVSR